MGTGRIRSSSPTNSPLARNYPHTSLAVAIEREYLPGAGRKYQSPGARPIRLHEKDGILRQCPDSA